jgi:hypothetical protein
LREQSISVYFARAVLKHSVERGLDPVELLRKNRISPRLLLEDSARISIERFADLQVSTMLAMQDEALGYAERRIPVGCWSMMCHAVLGSESLGQAIGRYCRFFQLFEGGCSPQLEQGEDTSRIYLPNANGGHSFDSYLQELVLFNIHRFSSWLVQEHLPLQRVYLDYAPTAPAEEYRRMFLANPMQFEQDTTALVFASNLLDKRVTQNEQSLRHFLRHPALIMLTQNYARNSWTSRNSHVPSGVPPKTAPSGPGGLGGAS